MARLPNPQEQSRVGLAVPRGVASYRAGAVEAAASEFGTTLQRLAQEEGDKLSKTQAQEAFNKLRQKQLDLTMGEPADKATGLGGGYLHRKGGNVVATPEGGKPFLDDYREQFKRASDDLASGLQGGARAHFDQLAQNAYLDFQSGLVRHSLQESDAYDKQVFSGGLLAETQAAGANWNNPAALAIAKSNALALVDTRVAQEGTEPKSAEAARRKALADLHSAVVDGALTAGDARYADSYLKANKDDFSAEGLLQATNKVYAVRKNQVAAEAASKVSKRIANTVMPTDFDRLKSQVAFVESGGKHFDSLGNVKASKKKAYGLMQVTEEAGIDAAKELGIPFSLEKLKSDEAYNELIGATYLSMKLREFDGDTEKALAAYNAGAGNVRKAVKAAEGFAKKAEFDPKIKAVPWQDLLPKPEETKPYIAKVLAGYHAGAGPSEPNVLEVRKLAAEEVLRTMPDARADVVEAAQAKAERDFNDMRTARDQERDTLANQLRARVDAGELRDYNSLLPSDLAVLGAKRDDVRKYIEAGVEAKAEVSPAVMAQYHDLAMNPQRLLAMPVPEIMALAPEIGQKNVSRLLTKRDDYQRQPELAVTVDADMFKATAAAYGVKDKEEQIVLKDRVDEAIARAQSAGKALTREEKRQVIKDLALELPKVSVPGGGWFGADTVKKMRAFQVQEPQNIIIPEDYRKKISERAAEKGVILRTDAQWRDAFRALLQEEKEIELAKG